MESKEWRFYVESEDEGRKDFLLNGESLLQFLKDNDPVVCGAMELSLETCRKLDVLGPDDTIPEEELI